uniref:hypothetical protein n=1 Tax=Enterocloster clostridioformis TaxID=1531 RepID=UPI0025A5333B|nr:hypothetical protein [Enterocloster clostridioformis]
MRTTERSRRRVGEETFFRGVCCAGLFLLDFLGIAGKSIRLKIPSKKTIGMS